MKKIVLTLAGLLILGASLAQQPSQKMENSHPKQCIPDGRNIPRGDHPTDRQDTPKDHSNPSKRDDSYSPDKDRKDKPDKDRKDNPNDNKRRDSPEKGKSTYQPRF